MEQHGKLCPLELHGKLCPCNNMGSYARWNYMRSYLKLAILHKEPIGLSISIFLRPGQHLTARPQQQHQKRDSAAGSNHLDPVASAVRQALLPALAAIVRTAAAAIFRPAAEPAAAPEGG